MVIRQDSKSLQPPFESESIRQNKKKKRRNILTKQTEIDKMMQEIEESDGNVEFISISLSEQPEEDLGSWFWNLFVKWFWLR